MPRGFSPLKVKRRVDALQESGEPFTLVDEAKKLNLTSKQFLSFVHERKAPVERIPAKFMNCVVSGNYVEYRFVKGGITP